MQAFHTTLPTEPRLRVVFEDSAFSFGLPRRTTLADVAGWVADVARIHHSMPLAIDVILAAARRPGISTVHSHGAR
jgi:hypothetical protein